MENQPKFTGNHVNYKLMFSKTVELHNCTRKGGQNPNRYKRIGFEKNS